MALRRRRNKFNRLLREAPVLAVVLSLLASPAFAGWRSDMGTFRIGVAMQNGERYRPEQFEGFRKAVSDALQMPVEIFQARDAAALIDAQATSRIEYSILSALGYATVHDICECIEPLAAPVNRDGATGVRSVLLADRTRVAQIAQLAAVRVAVGPTNSLGGDLLPAAGFTWQGRKLDESALDLVEVSTTGEAMRMLAAGDVGAAFGWEYVRQGSALSASGGPSDYASELSGSDIEILWRSEAIRFGPHAVRRNLPAEAKTALRRMLLALDERAPLVYDAVSPALGGGFEPASPDDYRSAIALIETLKTSAAGK
jgi:phosphonate transport system substrate-binding protein